MKRIASLTLLPALLCAHPDYGTVPGAELKQPVLTGNGAWTYQAVPGWGDLPDKKPIGPTHGGVLTGPDGKYISARTTRCPSSCGRRMAPSSKSSHRTAKASTPCS